MRLAQLGRFRGPHRELRRQAPGFTFIELIMTLAVLAVLAAVTVPVAQLAQQRSKEQALRISLREVRTAIDAYKRAFDEGRIRRKAEDSGYPPALNALVEGVVDQTDPKGRRIYFLRRLPADPISAEPDTEAADSWATRSYESPPDEPKPGRDVYDISSRSQAVGINGVPYRRW